MKFRKSVLPRTISDACCVLLLLTFIPITFIFEMYTVLPDFHDTDGVIYTTYWILGLFLVFNLKGNLLASMLVDTSIRTSMLKPPTKPNLRKFWRFCDSCETLVPPRSWHCQVCRTCILKRDHHCMFAGCCIGHFNHRYFAFVMLYLFIGSTVATIYNSIYFWWLHVEIYAKTSTAIKMLFPMLMFTMDISWLNLHLLIYELNVIAMFYSMLLMTYHMPVMLRGCVIYEHGQQNDKYNAGWRENLKLIFGERMHWAWLAPFVHSSLPHDGVHWEHMLQQSSKNR